MDSLKILYTPQEVFLLKLAFGSILQNNSDIHLEEQIHENKVNFE